MLMMNASSAVKQDTGPTNAEIMAVVVEGTEVLEESEETLEAQEAAMPEEGKWTNYALW